MNALDRQEAWPVALSHAWEVHGGQGEEREIETALEEPLALHINGHQVAVLMRLPGMEVELVAGFCVSEGLVSGFADMLTIHHCGQGLPSPGEEAPEGTTESRNIVEVRVPPEALHEDARLEVVRLIRAGCGAVGVTELDLALPPVQDGPTADPQTLLGLGKAMREGQRLRQRVGGVHAAAAFDAGRKLAVVCEDIGRHNAVDKAVGYCLLRDVPLQDKILLCSGRLSYEMVTKAIRLGIPVLASMSAPTALALRLAERFNLTLVGYLRGRRMTIYTHPERISFGV